ncbi:hypothetical protein [Streptomyces sp. NPDC088785]|uniref:hypothetical protein n=1 Tax=Streptomyces sp. NPDC088785 TaxID=3365897 RepID=UPI00382F0121
MDDLDGMDREDRLLMLALCGEPLPDDEPGAADVAADLALLRAQVRGLGDALAARPAPEPAPHSAPVPVPAPGPRPDPVVPAPVRRRAPDRRRRLVRIGLGALVAACAAGVLGSLVWLGVSAPGGVSVSSDSDKAAPGDRRAGGSADGSGDDSVPGMHIACSKVLVEGRVVSVTPRAGGDVRVVVDVARYYRPERSAREHPTLAVTLDGSARADLAPGTYALIRTPVFAGDRQDWETGPGVREARGEILDALPRARGLSCAGPGR